MSIQQTVSLFDIKHMYVSNYSWSTLVLNKQSPLLYLLTDKTHHLTDKSDIMFK